MHADSVLAVVGVIFAAGVFTGILSGTGMVEAMSKGFVAVIPPSLGPYLSTNHRHPEYAFDILHVE
jgi:CitMHS family citrate-Mg2+:H+ or citrate-Ca2+:H+ symporter